MTNPQDNSNLVECEPRDKIMPFVLSHGNHGVDVANRGVNIFSAPIDTKDKMDWQTNSVYQCAYTR